MKKILCFALFTVFISEQTFALAPKTLDDKDADFEILKEITFSKDEFLNESLIESRIQSLYGNQNLYFKMDKSRIINPKLNLPKYLIEEIGWLDWIFAKKKLNFKNNKRSLISFIAKELGKNLHFYGENGIFCIQKIKNKQGLHGFRILSKNSNQIDDLEQILNGKALRVQNGLMSFQIRGAFLMLLKLIANKNGGIKYCICSNKSSFEFYKNHTNQKSLNISGTMIEIIVMENKMPFWISKKTISKYA